MTPVGAHTGSGLPYTTPKPTKALNPQPRQRGTVRVLSFLEPSANRWLVISTASQVRWNFLGRIHTDTTFFFEMIYSTACFRKPSAHLSPNFLFAFVFKVLVSSKILNLPVAKTFLKKMASMGLVRQSGSMIAVEIHLQTALPSACSLICITSIVVRHFWQFGTASLVTRSNRDLQSVTSRAFGCSLNAFSGFCHWKFGSFT